MNWETVSWDEFERSLIEYGDHEYLGRSRVSGENAYLLIYDELAGVPMAERAMHVDSLVLFLNRWACHFPTKTDETRRALRDWIEREHRALEALADITLLDPELEAYGEETGRLYESLVALRNGDGPRIPTMGDAAASKILHLMVPRLFVMWDKVIKKGGWRYADFLIHMHRLAARIRDDLAPEEARADIDGYLQTVLGYRVRKPLAKYIDEYNWWLERGATPSPSA